MTYKVLKCCICKCRAETHKIEGSLHEISCRRCKIRLIIDDSSPLKLTPCPTGSMEKEIQKFLRSHAIDSNNAFINLVQDEEAQLVDHTWGFFISDPE